MTGPDAAGPNAAGVGATDPRRPAQRSGTAEGATGPDAAGGDGATVTAVVHVRVPASLRPYAGGSAVVDVDLSSLDGAPTVGAVLDHLAAAYPDLERRVRDEQRRLRRHVNLFLGDENVRDLAEQDTTVSPGDDLAVIPAVSGG